MKENTIMIDTTTTNFNNDEEESQNNLNRILNKFRESYEDLGLGLGNTEQFLIESLQTDSNICLICIESVGVKEPVWNCDGCYAQFHINCIQNWIRDGSYLVSASASNFDKNLNQNDIPWNCPKCRREYPQSKRPSVYYCYCKKAKNPSYDPWSAPHSCNQRCEKLKACGHSCKLLCHPGPCPPCPVQVKSSCFCAKSSPVARRCCNKLWSCNQSCNKLLGCKQHLCKEICHAGECGACQMTSIQFCKCKKTRKEVSCTQTIWQCEQKCNRAYTCGFHKCEIVCHEPGKCGECPRTQRRSCPCGKSNIQRPCNEDIPTCGDTCDKLLDCGLHRCVRRCHLSSCDQCREIIKKKCRCGKKEKEAPCSVEFICDNKCTRLRNCGNHKCSRKCCDGSCPPCEQICNKPLSCKNHKCASVCHSGPCYPCPLTVEKSCTCGSSKLKVPCIKSKAEIKVPCREFCKLPAKCHHDKIQAHRCHYGLCPPCNLKCGKALACGHICPSNCHSAVLTQIIDNKKREGPWVPINVRQEFVNNRCNDCVQPVLTKCLGKHEESYLPCHRAQQPYNCGRKCGEPLACTHHTCELECHDKQESSCQPCELACEQSRPKGCEHECSLGVCHPGKCPPCTKLIKMKCHCGSNFVHVECNKWNNNTIEEDREQLKSCKVPCSTVISCGHNCSKLCHSSAHLSASKCEEKVVLKCECKNLRKSQPCNQINRNDETLIKRRSTVDADIYFLKCNEKCAEKKKLKSNQQEQAQQESTTSLNSGSNIKVETLFNSRFIVAMTSLIILIASLALYYLLFNSSNNGNTNN